MTRIPDDTVALIFDCDGTLADTMPLHYKAWQFVLVQAGIEFTEQRFYQLGGMPTEKIIRLLSEETGVPVHDPIELTHAKENAYMKFLEDVRPIEPVARIARDYHRRLPISVASGGYRNVIHRTLEQIQMREFFEVVVCAEDTTRHKPEPDVFLEAARRMGIHETSRCVVFEDTDLGLEAARRAGMTGIDIRKML